MHVKTPQRDAWYDSIMTSHLDTITIHYSQILKNADSGDIKSDDARLRVTASEI